MTHYEEDGVYNRKPILFSPDLSGLLLHLSQVAGVCELCADVVMPVLAVDDDRDFDELVSDCFC
ncbi:hypothetical protein IQ60_23525 [Streptomyces europaeiscabiei]|nr:hypothetical protein IQ60_23525 [Streptomyces europaeiscabiei]